MKEYYKLTDEDKGIITKYFNNRNLEELLDFIGNGVNIRAGIHAVHYVTNLVREHGAHVLLNNCDNCAKQTTCDCEAALTCGRALLGWEEKV